MPLGYIASSKSYYFWYFLFIYLLLHMAKLESWKCVFLWLPELVGKRHNFKKSCTWLMMGTLDHFLEERTGYEWTFDIRSFLVHHVSREGQCCMKTDIWCKQYGRERSHWFLALIINVFNGCQNCVKGFCDNVLIASKSSVGESVHNNNCRTIWQVWKMAQK